MSQEDRKPILADHDDEALFYPNSGCHTNSYESDSHEYRVYRRRWYILAVAAIFNLTNGAIWISFSPIADLTASFYGVSLDLVNWLSLVYLVVFLPFGLCSAWIVDTLGLRTSIIFGTGLNAIGAILRLVSALSAVPLESRFIVVMIGQTTAAFAQPLAMIIPVKIAALWFGSDQRTTANAIGSLMNPLGIMIANLISPLILDGDDSRMIWLMVALTIGPVMACVMAIFGVCQSTPSIPPSASAKFPSEPFFKGLKQMCKYPMFWVLCITFGVGLGGATALSTLIQQIFCPRGYSDKFAGVCGALFLACGVVLAGLTALIVDKWKIFEGITKVYMALASLCFIGIAEISRYSGLNAAIIAIFCLAGMFSFPILPLSLELAIESTYPVAEATTSSSLILSGQVFGIVFILGMQVLTREMPANYEFSYKHCNVGNSTSPNMDYTVSTLSLSSVIAVSTVIFLIFYRADYRRLNAEKRLAALKILRYSSSSSLVVEPDSSQAGNLQD